MDLKLLSRKPHTKSAKYVKKTPPLVLETKRCPNRLRTCFAWGWLRDWVKSM